MKRTTAIISAVVVVGSAVAVTTGITAATSSGDADTPIVGDDLKRASRAALDHTGEGRVSETEVGDEDSYFEVEVTLDDGSQVDVQLDRDFSVVETMADDDNGNDATDGG